MPRPKVNVYVSHDRAPVVKGAKCDYCPEADCYFIDVDELREKMRVSSVFMERAFFDRQGEKYSFSNPHVKKGRKGITMEAVFEKDGCDEFIIIDELDNVIANVETTDFEIIENRGDFLSNCDCSQLCINRVPRKDFLKDAFMRGVYVKKEGKRRYFSRFHIDKDKECNVTVIVDVDDDNTLIRKRG